MFFKDIEGKHQLKTVLIKSVDTGRIPHAQLFLSREGAGGLPVALALASYIMCENRLPNDSCGSCSHCRKSHKYIHPDIHYSFPVVRQGDKKRESTTSDDFLPKWRAILDQNPFMGKSDWFDFINEHNSTPNINTKECVDIMHKLNMKAYESDKKILIMWLPEYLGNEGNRLLKLIEEPTDNTFIILVSENQEQILQTILSRCQLIKIPPFTNADIVNYLGNNMNISSEKAEQIAHLADGNLNLAMAISNNQQADYSHLIISWLRVAYKSDPLEINQWIKEVDGLNKEEQKSFLEYGLHFFRQFNFRLLTHSDNIHLTQSEKEVAKNMEKVIDINKAEVICMIINELVEYIPRNINLKIALYADTLKIGKILKNQIPVT